MATDKKTIDGWNKSKKTLSEYLVIGDTVDSTIYDYFIGVLPPATMTDKCVQIGEPMRHNSAGDPVYMTLDKDDGQWRYTGILAGPEL